MGQGRLGVLVSVSLCWSTFWLVETDATFSRNKNPHPSRELSGSSDDAPVIRRHVW